MATHNTTRDLPRLLSKLRHWPPLRITLVRCDEDWRKLKKARAVVFAPNEVADRAHVARECQRAAAEVMLKEGREEPTFWKLVFAWTSGQAPDGGSSSDIKYVDNAASTGATAMVVAGEAGLDELPPELTADLSDGMTVPVVDLSRADEDPRAAAMKVHMLFGIYTARERDVATRERTMAQERVDRVYATTYDVLRESNNLLKDENAELRKDKAALQARVADLEKENKGLRGEGADAAAAREDARIRDEIKDFAFTAGAPILLAIAHRFAPGLFANIPVDSSLRALIDKIQAGEPLTAGEVAIIKTMAGGAVATQEGAAAPAVPQITNGVHQPAAPAQGAK